MPADIKNPDMNSGEPWSEMDVADLAICAASGTGAAATATFLCRGIDETVAKARELGLALKADDRHHA
jgi:hypothetical protein